MSYSTAVLLGLVQGVTEFLPVSSSGHLTLIQFFTSLSSPPLLTTILVHLATLLAVIIYFRKQLVDFFTHKIPSLVVGTLPAAVVGLVVYKTGQSIFESPLLVGLSLLVTSVLLFSSRLFKKGSISLDQIQPRQALIIGLFQSLAILPGISRSGATIVSGLYLGLSPQAAFSFSFLLSIPAILGAVGLSMPDLVRLDASLLLPSTIAFFSALVAGLVSLKILDLVIKKERIFEFGFYTLVLASLVLGLFI